MSNRRFQYLLITAAKNEAAFIELTIQSVVNQTQRPVLWIIVNDGSTDGTEAIVKRHVQKHDWIEMLQTPIRRQRDFASKANCVNAAYAHAKELYFDAIASLDADVSFDKEYFAFLMEKLAGDPRLGVVGTRFTENGKTYDYRFTTLEYVSGPSQVFRRACFEAIGGYVPVTGGGLDVIAVITARMKGWQTRTFMEEIYEHHRPMGSATNRHRCVTSFKFGQRAYRLGYHPVWQTCRSAYQMTRRPYVVGGFALFLGYFWAMLKRIERPVSSELIAFQRADQMRRLRTFLRVRIAKPAVNEV